MPASYMGISDISGHQSPARRCMWLLLICQPLASLSLVPVHDASHYALISSRKPTHGPTPAAGDLWDCISWPPLVRPDAALAEVHRPIGLRTSDRLCRLYASFGQVHERVHGTYWLVSLPGDVASDNCLGSFFPSPPVLYNNPAETAKKIRRGVQHTAAAAACMPWRVASVSDDPHSESQVMLRACNAFNLGCMCTWCSLFGSRCAVHGRHCTLRGVWVWCMLHGAWYVV